MHVGTRALATFAATLLLASLTSACASASDDGEAIGETSSGLESDVSCTGETEPAYRDGQRIDDVEIIRIDGEAVAKNTGHAFLELQKTVAARGLDVRIESGFRTMREQEHLWQCYQTRRCNSGNLAARPGYSNHQSGVALDLSSPNRARLARIIDELGLPWKRTVPGEPWHFEYVGGAVAGPCDR